ncbi:MAG TPA: diguanylate cyclase [Thermoanaerobaculia bacterium]|nr:diguanylate cyclase [Thermoanaerobaculia bacterium]
MNPRRVLVVDDSELSRSLIRQLLERQGYEVLTAGDGAEGAVVALREHPDVVVTDLEMPVMDGYQLARLLKSDPATTDIPLLLITAHQEASSRFWGLETGADHYLPKDELDRRLLPAVEALLVGTGDRGGQAVTPPQTALEVLARVSRHLDARLLEAVLVNRILERGMQAEGVEEAADAVLRTVSDFIDAGVVGLALSEPEAALVFLRQSVAIEPALRDRLVETCVGRLGVPPEVPRQVVVQDERPDASGAFDPAQLELLPLPLRGARGVLVMAPKRPFGPGSRAASLLRQVTSHLALVVDNARLAQRLRELSMLDGLTRLLNRRTIHQRLCEEMERARRYRQPLSVVLCDLDHFKQINDSHGHLAGDAALTAVAEILRQQARAEDVVGRYGGEEFLLLLPNTDLEAASLAARRLLARVGGEPIAVGDGMCLRVTASLGTASLSELGADSGPEALLAIADERLYRAKAEGRNRAVP